MKAKLVVTLGGIPSEQFPEGTRPAGSVIEDPDAWKLVWLGVAVPADDECEKRANMTSENMLKAQAAQAKATAGLLPEDYAAWDAGYMRGYNPDGTWKPGPNADELAEDEWEERKRNSPLVFPEDEQGWDEESEE